MTTKTCFVKARFVGDESYLKFGPFADGDEASRWGFDMEKNEEALVNKKVEWFWFDASEPQEDEEAA